jgi:hypothetical protein
MKRGALCEYDTDPDVSRATALRRKNHALQNEIGYLTNFFNHIRDCPEAEAKEMFWKIRKSDDRQYVDFFRTEWGLPMNQDRQSEKCFSMLEKLESSTPASSGMRVAARPWATPANDGLVSKLISTFFAYDHRSHILFIEQECFLAEMLVGDITRARFCSPFLVNAICALRCVSPETRTLSSNLTVRMVVYNRASQNVWSIARRECR